MLRLGWGYVGIMLRLMVSVRKRICCHDELAICRGLYLLQFTWNALLAGASLVYWVLHVWFGGGPTFRVGLDMRLCRVDI